MTRSPASSPRSLGDHLTLLLAEGCGLGCLPVAPGTFGSLPGVPLGWLLWHWQVPVQLRLALWLVMFLIGIPLCQRAAFLRGKKDPGSVVWDEIAAFPLIFSMIHDSWMMLVGGFLLFRVFDIVKPWPVKRFERLPGGLGIMADDQIAALYAGAVLVLLQSCGL
jgi:phosphatidylglycerophosphatase A